MPGYLDQYGAGEDRRIRIVKVIAISLASIVILGGILYYVFHNYREERQAKQFFALLAGRDYKSAYALFGCTDAHPCKGYTFDRFMEDWGPKSPHANIAAAHITRSRSCGSGVLLTVSFGSDQAEKLWVERKDMSIGYPPFDGCPALQ
jgi:hypothetical protein